MRILHVLTLVDTKGAYGGPLRVALNQAKQLSKSGHEVHIAAGWSGSGTAPAELEGVPCFIFKAVHAVPLNSFSALVAPHLFVWLFTNVRKYDAVHVHAGRDLISIITMIICIVARRAYVTQTHGMIIPDQRPLVRALDVLLMQGLLQRAGRRFVLNDAERIALGIVMNGRGSLTSLPNGVPSGMALAHREENEVLYCARLQRRKRPTVFVEVAAVLHHRGIAAKFCMVGPDGGELASVRAAIRSLDLETIVQYEGSLEYRDVLDRLQRTSVYVLPSVNEPYPMSLLEALSVGIPSVCVDSCGIADVLKAENAALVTDGSVTALADAVHSILTDSELRNLLRRNAQKVVASHFSMDSIGADLIQNYDAVRSDLQISWHPVFDQRASTNLTRSTFALFRRLSLSLTSRWNR